MTEAGQRHLEGDVAEFVAAFRDVVLFCRDRSGQPIGYPMRTVACTDSALTFTTYRKSAKVQNLERDGRVCVLAVDHAAPDVRWVSVAGEARVVVPSDAEIEATFGTTGPEVGEGRVPSGMGELVKQRLRQRKRILIQVEDLECAGIEVGSSW